MRVVTESGACPLCVGRLLRSCVAGAVSFGVAEDGVAEDAAAGRGVVGSSFINSMVTHGGRAVGVHRRGGAKYCHAGGINSELEKVSECENGGC